MVDFMEKQSAAEKPNAGVKSAEAEFVRFKDVYRFYKMGDNVIKAANGVSFSIGEGEFCVIVGPSGAGKTTVLNMLGGMDSVTEGEIFVDGVKVSSYNEKQLTLYRRYDVGFVFQFYNLIQNLTALENVEIASEICKNPLDAKKTLEQVGLAERMNNFPAQLSGGEPTGALDYETGKNILKLLHEVCRQNKKTVIVITHNQAITRMADRVIHIKNGQVFSEEVNEHPEDVSLIEW